jgi:hypothetical protein
VADEEVDEEEAAIRAIDDADEGPEAPPLCPRCRRRQHVFWTSDSRDCPLCNRGGRSGSWVICEACAKEAAVCVFDCLPLDGTSDDAVPWLAEVVATARRAREQEQFGPRER